MPAQDCQAEACGIQDCLTQNGYNEAKCQAAVRKLYQCCADMYAAAEKKGLSPEAAKSTACPIPSVVQRKLKSLDQ